MSKYKLSSYQKQLSYLDKIIFPVFFCNKTYLVGTQWGHFDKYPMATCFQGRSIKITQTYQYKYYILPGHDNFCYLCLKTSHCEAIPMSVLVQNNKQYCPHYRVTPATSMNLFIMAQGSLEIIMAQGSFSRHTAQLFLSGRIRIISKKERKKKVSTAEADAKRSKLKVYSEAC